MRESQARGSQLSTAEGAPGTPLCAPAPILPIPLLAEVGALTQLSVGWDPHAGGGHRSPGLGSIHGSRAWGQNGNVPGKSATPVPSSQDVPGDVCDRGEQQPCPTTEHCHLLGTAGTVLTQGWGPGPGTGSSGSLAPLSPR